MGLSVAKDELYYIYVLRVEDNGWYVGSTQSFERRMRSHFGLGGSVATRERKAVSIEEVFELRDYQIRTDCAHERAEVLIAQRYAKLYGMDKVRGAKHGKGWNDAPSQGNLRDIDRYNKFACSSDGERLMKSLRRVSPVSLLPDKLNGALARLEVKDGVVCRRVQEDSKEEHVITFQTNGREDDAKRDAFEAAVKAELDPASAFGAKA